jgi:hypothetical protein
MKYVSAYSHNYGKNAWEDRDEVEWITDIFDAPSIKIEKGITSEIREHVENELMNAGWALNVPVQTGSGISVLATKDDLAFHLQTGNVSRVAYDLLKLECLFKDKKIKAAALALPCQKAAQKLGSNIANYERLVKELAIFDHVITTPILVIGFE